MFERIFEPSRKKKIDISRFNCFWPYFNPFFHPFFDLILHFFIIPIQIPKNHDISLMEFNLIFLKWLEWYDFEKSYRFLPLKKPPTEFYLQSPDRFFRPLEYLVDWYRWLNTGYTRKVTKQNYISFRGDTILIPRGYAGNVVEVIGLYEIIEE